jgi:metalloproteinase inhibitor 3
MSEKSERLLKYGRIMTPTSDSMCGVEFKIGQLYLISGRDHNVNMCNFVKEYSKMTIVEKRGVAGGYAYGCSCEVKPSFSKY